MKPPLGAPDVALVGDPLTVTLGIGLAPNDGALDPSPTEEEEAPQPED